MHYLVHSYQKKVEARTSNLKIAVFIFLKFLFLFFINNNKNMPIDGIEPPTFALQERRSTTKPNRHFIAK
ncbi:hypothetical protein U3516DRAFT_772539 [Neocallimastix sp. 'constans']